MSHSTDLSIDAERLIHLRHHLHQIPELAFEEFKTADVIREELDRLNIEHTDGVPDAPTATVGLIGDPTLPCVALRADFDALPIVERTGLPYASTHEGRMHACGHDGHTTVLLGAAAVLKANESRLPVCVKLLHQPAEEILGGAARMIAGGVMDGRLGPRPVAVFGLHGSPNLDVGCVSVRHGATCSGDDTFRVTFTGRGSHGAAPHLSIDPIVTACSAVMNLQQIVSRRISPHEPAVVSIGQFNAGTATNIIPDSATITGTARCVKEERRATMRQWIERRCAAAAEANECEMELTWLRGCPPGINDASMADYAAQTARRVVGEENFQVLPQTMGSEDFAYFLQQTPGCFFRLGVRPRGRDTYPGLHNDHFDFTDEAVPHGVRMFVELVMNYE